MMRLLLAALVAGFIGLAIGISGDRRCRAGLPEQEHGDSSGRAAAPAGDGGL